MVTKKKAKADTVKNMKKLGVYRAEYNGIIDIYAELLEQYATLTQKFIDSGSNCVSLTADGGEKKSPIVATLESLRKDLLQYSDRLMLHPKANQDKKQKSVKEGASLAEVLKNIGNESG